MYKEVKVKYDAQNGPLTVKVINPGYANQGIFSLNLTDGNVIQPLGKGSFSDTIPDTYIIHISPSALEDWMLILLGNYAAAFGHNQISVDYVFFQRDQEIKRESIRLKGTSLSAHHDFTFKK